jgi:hypothetical protein
MGPLALLRVSRDRELEIPLIRCHVAHSCLENTDECIMVGS